MPEVVILGCGFAGGAMALRAMQLGFSVTLLESPRPDIGGIEILPSRARHLLNELRLESVLESLEPGLGSGMLRRGGDGAPQPRVGRALHLDRLALRKAVIAEALSRGAEIRRFGRDSQPPGGVFAHIDASGRFAAWSHPVRRHDRARADIFQAPPALAGDIAQLVQMGTSWAYAAADRRCCTIGMVHYGEFQPGRDDDRVRSAFGLDAGADLRHLGRRPALVQEASEPIRGRTIAIGDAAFCHNPIAGRGLSFAMGSVFAAGAVLQTWRDHPDREELVRGYYRSYVAAERDRHLAYMAHGEEATSPAPLPSHVVWSAPETKAALALPEGIQESIALQTESGAPARWLGAFDLLDLKTLCDGVQPTERLAARLEGRGITASEAWGVVRWALQNGLIRARRGR